jgi:hypothetical protein
LERPRPRLGIHRYSIDSGSWLRGHGRDSSSLRYPERCELRSVGRSQHNPDLAAFAADVTVLNTPYVGFGKKWQGRHGHAQPSKIEPLESLEIYRWTLLHHGGLGADDHRLAVTLHEDIRPDPFAAGAFSIGGALFRVAALANPASHLTSAPTTRRMKPLKCSKLRSLANVGGVQAEPAGPKHTESRLRRNTCSDCIGI